MVAWFSAVGVRLGRKQGAVAWVQVGARVKDFGSWIADGCEQVQETVRKGAEKGCEKGCGE